MAIPWGTSIGVVRWLLDAFRKYRQQRRKVRVLVHRGYFPDGGGSLLTTPLGAWPPTAVTGAPAPSTEPPYYFMKITNLSPQRSIRIEGAWFASKPPVDVVKPDRPLPKTPLQPDDDGWELWIDAADLSHARKVEWLGRVSLPNGKVVKSRPNKNVRPRGFVAGRTNFLASEQG